MTDKHTLCIFDEDLKALNNDVLDLTRRVGDALDGALDALLSGDAAKARAVIASDRQADDLQTRINAHTARTLMRQQPMANDLRAILAAARIAPHLERIGDYAKNTAKRSLRLNRAVDAEIGAQLRWMVTRIQSMLRRVGEAYAAHDAKAANVAWADDAELDAVYSKLFAHLLTIMRDDRARIDDSTQLLFIAKGLERAGDHVTDIAEEVYLMVTGKPLQGPRPKVDESGVDSNAAA
ncbi:Phosphate-specific transport system accessory protein PhoU [Candidatus Nitrotoga sp. BS]|uniref:phosphate signaling complex protein PhoU n=1 Tax=Candidatus Nitrotoga sp. BS TaxID=2890408 RepID=UPI001EF293FE|nr:phosphate signaling complex protein PhoU [Candidatus Nitrotoga sp. BS]CAH1205900.1 Phosphate-specific transport system accessory protein PhoU [Candidatus Nitrotoga sp. BS]